MKKSLRRGLVVHYILTAMKYSAGFYIFLSSICCLAAADGSLAQALNKSVSVHLKNVTLNEALDKISASLNVNIIFTGKLPADTKTSLRATKEKLGDLLPRLLGPYHLSFTVVENNIVIKKADSPKEGRIIKGSSVAADTILVRGRVLDQKEPPGALPGVTAVIKGTQKGATADMDGFFELYTKPGDVIVFSFVGFTTKEYVVSGRESNLIVSLAENATALNEVVVTGFSEQKVKYLASSVSTISMNNVQNKPITQLSQALQGGTTGINVTQASGLPGGDAASVKIRGIGSLLGADPLVLVDGVPFDMNKLDPNTIENISILKDAAAASVYGARAGNGVILITTKRGVAGKIDVQYNGFYGTQTPMYKPDFVDAATYMEMVNVAQLNIGGTATYSSDAISQTRKGSDPVLYPNTNWGKLILKEQSPIQQHSLNVSGGNAAARFSLAANYLKQDGMMTHSGFSRGTVRANTSVDLSKNVVVFMDLFASRDEQNEPYAVNRLTADLLGWVYTAPPNIVSRFPEKPERPNYTFYGTYGESWNPLAQIEKGGTVQRIRDEVLINLRPKWDINRDLTLKGQFSYRVSSGVDKRDQEAYIFFDYFTNKKVGRDFPTVKTAGPTDRSSYYYAGGNLDYNKNIGSHRINGIAGYSQELNNAGTWNEIALISLFGKLYYSYNDKYLLEFGMRRDGSSLFDVNRKWGSFPSLAVGWNVINEGFMKKLAFVNQFKVRGSYGMLGNNNIKPYLFQTTVNTGNGNETSIGNPDISWEKMAILDIGTDLSFFNRQIDVTFDWYNKTTQDLILSPQPTLTSGLPQGTATTPVNIGSVKNVGWEFKIGYNKTVSKDLNFSVNLGLTKNRSEWIKLSQELPLISGSTLRGKGTAITEHYGFRSLGLLQQADNDSKVAIFAGQQAGDIRYEDINADGIISNDDRVSLGPTDAQMTYFGNLSFKFKNFDFETLVTGTGNVATFYSGRIAIPLNVAGEGGTPLTWHTDYWTPTNTTARFPRLLPSPGNNGLFSDYWLVNGAFARVKYLQVGYNVPIGQRRVKGLRVYLNAQNPLTFTKMEIIDPETRGDQKTYPMFKTYTLGVNIRF